MLSLPFLPALAQADGPAGSHLLTQRRTLWQQQVGHWCQCSPAAACGSRCCAVVHSGAGLLPLLMPNLCHLVLVVREWLAGTRREEKKEEHRRRGSVLGTGKRGGQLEQLQARGVLLQIKVAGFCCQLHGVGTTDLLRLQAWGGRRG